MIKIEEVAEATYRLETTLPGSRFIFSAYLLKENGGVLLEPGPATMTPFILEGMKQLDMQSLSYIIPSHIHLDHGGGSGTLAGLFPQAMVVIHPRGARHAADPSRLIASTKLAYGDAFELVYGPILPVPEKQIKAPEDGEIIGINGRELQIIHAPGHALHHIAVYDRKTGGLFCGETLGLPAPGDEENVLPAVSAQDFYLDLYLETVEKLQELKPRLLFYVHGAGVREPGRLFSSLTKNTVMLRDVILNGLKNGETTETIERKIQEMLPNHRGTEPGDLGMDTKIRGYAAYFKKKGMI